MFELLRLLVEMELLLVHHGARDLVVAWLVVPSSREHAAALMLGTQLSD